MKDARILSGTQVRQGQFNDEKFPVDSNGTAGDGYLGCSTTRGKHET